MKIDGEFKLTSWDEETYSERAGSRKLTRAEVTQELDGEVEGKGSVVWLMSYADDGTAHFVGLQQFDGTIGERTGTVVLETIGDFDGGEAKWKATVVEGSGTGDWDGMRGTGAFRAPHGSKATFTLDCSFDGAG